MVEIIWKYFIEMFQNKLLSEYLVSVVVFCSHSLIKDKAFSRGTLLNDMSLSK